MGGVEDLVLVLLQRLNPVLHIGGLLLGIVRNAAFGRQKDTGQLGTQLFPSIIGIPETVGLGKRGPVQTREMSTPVCQLMQSRAVIAGGILESSLARQMDAVLR